MVVDAGDVVGEVLDAANDVGGVMCETADETR